MKRLMFLAVFAVLSTGAVSAHPCLIPLAVELGVRIGVPVALAAGYGLSHTPSLHLFGDDESTYGFDWGSLSSRSRNVYGLQTSLWGGGFSGDLNGLQCGILCSGWVDDGYDVSCCRMNGIQFGTFAAKTATANGLQLSAGYSECETANGLQLAGFHCEAGRVNGMQCAFGNHAEAVNGLQCGAVNFADAVNGLQIGVYNYAASGHCVQLGLVNQIANSGILYLPVLNVGFE